MILCFQAFYFKNKRAVSRTDKIEYIALALLSFLNNNIIILTLRNTKKNIPWRPLNNKKVKCNIVNCRVTINAKMISNGPKI